MAQFIDRKDDVGILSAGFCLPGDPVDISDWAPRHGVQPELVERLLANGCRYFHIGCDKSDAALIGNALDTLFNETPIDPAKIGYLLHAHSQNFSVPAPPSSILMEIAGRYSLSPKLSFSVSHLACASVINAIMWASELLATDDHAEYALVVTADRVFGNAKHRIRQDAGIQSDGASAILLSKKEFRCRLGRFGIKNFARLHEGPCSPTMAAAIARYTWLHTKQLLNEMHADDDFQLDDYGAILPINADGAYWRYIAKGMALPDSKFYLANIGRRGHACCADFAVNLVDYGFSLIDKGMPVLSCGQSNVGAHAALALLPVSSTVSFGRRHDDIGFVQQGELNGVCV